MGSDEASAGRSRKGAAGSGLSDLTFAETVRELRGYLGPNLWRVATGSLLLIVAAVIGLLQPLAARWVLERLAEQDSLLFPVLALTGLLLLAAAGLGLGTFLMLSSAERVVLEGRLRLARRVLALTMTAMRAQAPGDLLARVTADSTLLRTVTIQALTQALLGGVTLLGALIAMGLIDLVLLGAVVFVTLLLGAFMSWVLPHVRAASAETQAAVGDLGSQLERTLNAFTLVKSSGAEGRELDRVHRAAETARRGGTRLARWSALAGSSAGVTTQAAFLIVLGFGGWRVQTGAMSATDLVAFLLYVFFLTAPVLQLIQSTTYFQAGRAALSRIAAVQRLEAEDIEPTDTPRPVRRDGWAEPAHLRFEDVTFSYPTATRRAVDGLDLDVPAGGLTALVGPSGAGKSTLFALLERFWDPDSGRILLDGKPLTDVPLEAHRAQLAYVEQHAPVMAGTLRDNLTYAAPDATDAEIHDALRACRLEHVLERRGSDLDAPVATGGQSLSGGERQRVAVARALLRRPRLLLLDEVTSQLDGDNEVALRETVREVARRTTVVVAAHRLSTVRDADRIVVMEDGRARAMGTHAELVREDELYSRLAASMEGLTSGTTLGDELEMVVSRR